MEEKTLVLILTFVFLISAVSISFLFPGHYECWEECSGWWCELNTNSKCYHMLPCCGICEHCDYWGCRPVECCYDICGRLPV